MIRRPGRRWRRGTLAAVVLAALAGWARWEGGSAVPGPEPEAEADALATARGLRAALRGLAPGRRDGARLKAAQAYLRAAEALAADPAARCEALFRAGELWRACGAAAEARAAFRRAAILGGEAPLAQRARLEEAHLDRRGGHLRRALEAYEALSVGRAAHPSLGDEALRWCAVVHAALGERGAAARRWRWLAAHARSPLARLHAFDQLARSELASGETERARGLLERCDAALAPRASELTPLGERVRRALERMVSRAELAARARAAR